MLRYKEMEFSFDTYKINLSIKLLNYILEECNLCHWDIVFYVTMKPAQNFLVSLNAKLDMKLYLTA